MPKTALVVLPENPSVVTSSAVAGAAAGVRSHYPTVTRLLVAPSPAAFLAGQWLSFQYGELLQPASQHWRPERMPALDEESWAERLREAEVGPIVLLGAREAAAACQKATLIKAEALTAVHVPVCGANSLAHTHHCLGYGSLARTVASFVAGEDLDNASFLNGVKIIVLEGDLWGWLAAGTALIPHIRHNHDAAEALLVVTPSNWAGVEAFQSAVAETLHAVGRATIVVSEGMADLVLDAQRPGAAATSRPERLGHEFVNAVLCAVPQSQELKVRMYVHGTFRTAHLGRPTASDQNESMWLAGEALRLAGCGHHGQSIVLDAREGRNLASPRLVPARLLAAGSRAVPESMFTGFRMNEGYVAYAHGLVGLPELPAAATAPSLSG